MRCACTLSARRVPPFPQLKYRSQSIPWATFSPPHQTPELSGCEQTVRWRTPAATSSAGLRIPEDSARTWPSSPKHARGRHWLKADRVRRLRRGERPEATGCNGSRGNGSRLSPHRCDWTWWVYGWDPKRRRLQSCPSLGSSPRSARQAGQELKARAMIAAMQGHTNQRCPPRPAHPRTIP